MVAPCIVSPTRRSHESTFICRVKRHPELLVVNLGHSGSVIGVQLRSSFDDDPCSRSAACWPSDSVLSRQ
jgi:hypothetical protein